MLRCTPLQHIRSIASLGLLLFAAFTFGQDGTAVPSRTLSVDEYESLKSQGTLPSSFHVSADVSAPIKQTKPIKPIGVAKGGGGVNPCDCWIEPDASYTLAMPPNDDLSSALINLPFQFNMYGDLYNTCYINNNGNVSFVNSYFTFSSTPFPDASYIMVAPFWADVETTTAGQVWYKVTPTALYVDWVGVGYFNDHSDKLNTFQLIITDGNDPVIGIGKNTSFCYEDMQWTTGDASGGVNGFGGTPSTVGANRGNGIDYIQFTRNDHDALDYDGPFGANDGVSWLDNKNFVFTTSVFTSNIPPIGSGIGLCDTLVACVGTEALFDLQFLSPEPGQTTTCTASSSMGGFAITLNVPGNTAHIVGQVIPVLADVGFQTITVQATDDGAPPLTSTYNIVVEVLVSAVMDPGSLTVCDTGPAVDMYSLLGVHCYFSSRSCCSTKATSWGVSPPNSRARWNAVRACSGRSSARSSTPSPMSHNGLRGARRAAASNRSAASL